MSRATDFRKEVLPDDDGSKIFVEFYQSGVDGPTVRLDVQSKESLESLRGLVRDFSNSDAVSALLEDADLFHWIDPMRAIRFQRIDKQSGESSELNNGVLTLALTPEGWVEAREKVESISGAGPASQDLESYRGRVTIELAYKE